MPNPPIKLAVRQLEQSDAAAVQRLYERAVGHAAWLPAGVKADADFARASQGEAVFVCYGPEGRLVGLLSVWVPESFIHHVYVDPEFERQGVGTVLLSSLEAWLPLPWHLKCVIANTSARAFYARHGWIEVGSGNGDQGPYALLERRSGPSPDASATTSTRVRSATKNDIPVLVELMREFYTESKYSLDGDWAVRSFNRLLQSTDRGAAWISFLSSDPAGYVVLTTRHSMEFGGLDGFVDDLFVRPAFRRHGVGTSLLTELFRECSKRHVLAVHIEVGSDNAPAQALCRRFGLSNNGRQLFTARVA